MPLLRQKSAKLLHLEAGTPAVQYCGAEFARGLFAPPAALQGGRRAMGLAAHLYALRGESGQGLGDFTIALWVRSALDDPAALPGDRFTPEQITAMSRPSNLRR